MLSYLWNIRPKLSPAAITKMIIYSRSRAAEKSRERGRGRQFQFFTNLLLWKEIIRCVADFTGMISSPLV